MERKKDSKIFTLLMLFSVLTVLFQTPQLMSLRSINYIIWPIFAFLLVGFQKCKVESTAFGKAFIVVYTMIVIQCIICSFFNDRYLDSNYRRITFLPLCMYWIGVQLYKWSDEKLIQQLFWSYLIATVVLAITLQLEYVPSIAVWKNVMTYLYAGKNSAAQILSSGILVAVYGIKNKNKRQAFVRIILAGYLFIVIGLLQCRTAMLALLAAAFIYMFLKTKHKGIAVGALAMIMTALYNIPIINSFIRQAFLLNKYQGADLNTFSSGRLKYYQEALAAFWENPFFGNGNWYVDDFFICVLAELGIVAGGALIVFWLYRIFRNIRVIGSRESGFLLLELTIYYAVTSVLEAYPPFGPGSCSFLFWILSGLTDSEYGRAGQESIG